MHLVYFSHSYRKEDSEIVRYFGQLISAGGLIPILDPPSEGVNAARLQRHLRDSDGMVAVLTRREGSVSPHILFEIALCMQARKPLLVFIEDVVTAEAVPPRVLRSRFSRRWFFRQVREHRHALRLFRTYLGEEPPPRYQPVATRQTCLTIGLETLHKRVVAGLLQSITEAGYEVATQRTNELAFDRAIALSETLACTDIVVEVVNSPRSGDHYLAGAVRAAFLPRISLIVGDSGEIDGDIPADYRPRLISREQPSVMAARNILAAEFVLYERSFMEIETPEEVGRYVDALVSASSPGGTYDTGVSAAIIGAVYMGDNIRVGQAGAVGRGARSDANTFQQVWNEAASDIDLTALAHGLTQLRAAARVEVETAEQEAALGQIASAEIAARSQDGPAALAHLRNAGKWALSVAEKIGVGVAIAAIKTAMGV